MRTLAVDIETYSSVDLPKRGVYPYTESNDFEVLLFAYSFDNEPVNLTDLASGEALPDAVIEALWDKKVIKTAFNAQFEITCLSRHFGKPLIVSQWRCTKVHAAFLGLPGSLAHISSVLKLEHGKMDEGKKLIEYFSKPCKPTAVNGGRTRNLPHHAPDKWESFKEYCKRDVEAEREISRKIAFFRVPDDEWQLWFLDQKINERGVLLDMDIVQNAIACGEMFKTRYKEESAKISGIENPNSNVQVKKWLEQQTGTILNSVDKNNINELLKLDLNPVVKRFIALRRRLSKTSISKYDAMARAVSCDGRLRGSLAFYGANRTGRWGGRIVQPHNLPRNYLKDLDLARRLLLEKRFEEIETLFGNPLDTLSQLVRTAFVAGEGNRFIVSDFSAIEARVIAWLAVEQWRLDVFNTHGKIYEASAAQMFGVPVEQVTKGSPLRQKGKVAELALGYQGGPGALIQMGALDNGLTEAELPELVYKWREANKKIVKFWYDLESAALEAVRERTKVPFKKGIELSYRKGTLFIQLPSGRRLSYLKARVEYGGKFNKERIVFNGVNQKTGKWQALDTYGGKLTENITQAVARDCLAFALMNIDAAGYDIVLHVHDEAVIEAAKGEHNANDIAKIMSKRPDWAHGLPLNADAYETEYYKKD